ncbi:MAG TPA: undecaprenyl-diphosphate phosphatase [Planctomycetota bacterium]|nr:undecaprenyl-diphosphate phosphatase [Planctomycetota bacterium]
MTLLQAALLGALQGIAEFLPISSSGHLCLARHLVPGAPPPDLAFDVLLHLGTAAAVITVFRAELAPLLRATPRLLAPARWRGGWAADPAFRTAALLLLSAVPAGVVGLMFHRRVEALEEHRPDVVALLLVVTGLWLLVASVRARRAARADADEASGAAPRAGRRAGREAGVREALLIGAAQAAAILPGVSRSAATLGAGLLAGVRRDAVGPFAFLMSVPVIVGAAALKARDLRIGGATDAGVMLVGVLVAYASGVAALRFLLPFVRRGRLEAFAAYCLLAGPVAWWALRGTTP